MMRRDITITAESAFDYALLLTIKAAVKMGGSVKSEIVYLAKLIQEMEDAKKLACPVCNCNCGYYNEPVGCGK